MKQTWKRDLRKMGKLLHLIDSQWDDLPVFWETQEAAATSLGLTKLSTLCRRVGAACVKNEACHVSWYGLYRELVTEETPDVDGWNRAHREGKVWAGMAFPDEETWPAWRHDLRAIATIVSDCDDMDEVYREEAICAEIEAVIGDRRILAAWRKARAARLAVVSAYDRVSEYVTGFVFRCPCCGEEVDSADLIAKYMP